MFTPSSFSERLIEWSVTKLAETCPLKKSIIWPTTESPVGNRRAVLQAISSLVMGCNINLCVLIGYYKQKSIFFQITNLCNHSSLQFNIKTCSQDGLYLNQALIAGVAVFKILSMNQMKAHCNHLQRHRCKRQLLDLLKTD